MWYHFGHWLRTTQYICGLFLTITSRADNHFNYSYRTRLILFTLCQIKQTNMSNCRKRLSAGLWRHNWCHECVTSRPFRSSQFTDCISRWSPLFILHHFTWPKPWPVNFLLFILFIRCVLLNFYSINMLRLN